MPRSRETAGSGSRRSPRKTDLLVPGNRIAVVRNGNPVAVVGRDICKALKKAADSGEFRVSGGRVLDVFTIDLGPEDDETANIVLLPGDLIIPSVDLCSRQVVSETRP